MVRRVYAYPTCAVYSKLKWLNKCLWDMEYFADAKQSEGGPRSVKSSRSLVVSLPRRPWSDQSTQISLDVRHYETMVSNLEKRLLDRELLVREMSQKMQTMQTDHKRKCDQDPRVKALEMQLSDLTSSYNEMALVKDSLLNTSRQETTCLRKKLMEAENLLLSALQMEEETGERSPPASIVSTDSPPSGPVTDDVQQIGRKLLAAFKGQCQNGRSQICWIYPMLAKSLWSRFH